MKQHHITAALKLYDADVMPNAINWRSVMSESELAEVRRGTQFTNRSWPVCVERSADQMNYENFIEGKFHRMPDAGFVVDDSEITESLFPFQRDIVKYACRRGRFGGFEDCGLGKTLQQLEVCRQIIRKERLKDAEAKALIFAPLAVAAQTKREAMKFGILEDIDVTVCKQQSDCMPGINVTNYERLHKFDQSAFVTVQLDEGSILKSVDGKIRTEFLSSWNRVKHPMTWTATPAPNDYMEIGNQSQFCGVLSREEMLATFFVHDGGETSKWRLKGHAQTEFWKWLASWCVMMRMPSDVGHSDDGYSLPGLQFTEHVVDSNAKQSGMLFAREARTMADRRQARKATLQARCELSASLANGNDRPWVIWCNLNDEGTLLSKLIPDAMEVAGRHSTDEKEERLEAFTKGECRVLITKPKIGGFGLNWQHCCDTAIMPTDSYEQWYQMIRRFWRFGQNNTVNVHAVASDLEGAVLANVKRKDADAERMFSGIVGHMKEISTQNVRGVERQVVSYQPTERMEIPAWLK
jgi:hypothetical protein